MAYGTANNRLGLYITCDMSVAGAVCDRNALTPAVVSYTVYHYNDLGNVTRVIVFKWNPLPNERQVTATRFVYARNGSTVSYVIGEAWDEVAADICQDNYDIRYAREFRYDGARQRYLVRELRTSSLEFGTVRDSSPPSLIWSDYDGDSIYGDFTVSGATLTQTAIYEPGIARSFAPSDGFATQYYHGDSLGTTRMFTNTTSPPSVLSESSYTAFGEQIGGVGQRYGYAGAFGYQTATSDTPGDAYATDFQFMHVGARYYDPATGRFLQRDPIGIGGGLNVYAYVNSTPSRRVDPSGLDPHVAGPWPPNWVEDYVPPPPPEKRQPVFQTDEDMKRELEELKKSVWVNGTIAGIGCLGGQWWLGVGVGMAALIDQAIHYDEPINPVFGGDYSAW